ncbi:MAG: tRNA pseudouridine(38-40) synthase TruA [Spirochaetales bacterium]|jgi:tRNA pseudouridine38-40 synthase|nr:tRNA pseudouridine(38-40) synthase TruA [Exilispira sp.]NMC67178.1 tRNA pseudouridine(38-40) synthase TruA [Spirochaetales bacterium]
MNKNDLSQSNYKFYHYIASLSYNGSEYSGFQIQKKDKTIQEQIENILLSLNQKSIKSLHPIEDKSKIKELTRIYFAGRTDSGVHAIENVVSFTLSKEFETEKVVTIFNNNLPKDIRFYNCKRTNQKINPRFAAIERVYLYVIYTGKKLAPFILNRAFIFNGNLNINKFEQCLKIFEGRHNFKFFTTSSEKRNPVRTIFETNLFHKNEFIFVFIRGDSFLHKQVRFMIGSAFMCGLNKIKIEEIVQMLDFEKIHKPLLNKNITNETSSIFVLPPEGLYLAKVRFDGEEQLKFEDILSFYETQY